MVTAKVISYALLSNVKWLKYNFYKEIEELLAVNSFHKISIADLWKLSKHVSVILH